ncbi:hypothetical protein BC938DRAFT_473224 [Jimgerdemannia flammicorona]|uniref:Uncharacterized protein n=1 Tax=Jimgerdemannia flammicorona TaxID=994334 RepID=A0A433Q4H5_9FUNG|nr:hypothetical protein BC938DRAFT_473224 [Jimgerdemannia flammicorona]
MEDLPNPSSFTPLTPRRRQYLELRALRCVHHRSLPTAPPPNVGRVLERDPDVSILLLTRLTPITVLGPAGYDHKDALELISDDNYPRIIDCFINMFVDKCKKLRVLSLRECLHVRDWDAVDELAQPKVLLTL